MADKTNKFLKTLFFVAPGESKTMARAIKKTASRSGFVVVSLDKDTQDELNAQDIQSKCMLSYLDKGFWDYAGKESIEWIGNWANQKILNNKSIKEKFIYQGVPLWWFGRNILFSTSGGIFDIISFINLSMDFIWAFASTKSGDSFTSA